jgi:signal transduction histidine kinase
MIRPHAGPARRPVPAIEDLAAPMSEPSSRKSAEPEYGNRPGHPPDASDRDSREQDGGSDEVRRRWAFLAEASRCLADSLDYETTIETVAGLALPLLGSWSIVDLTEPDGSISRLAIVHPDADKQEIARELKSGWPPRRDDPVGLSTVAQSGRSDLVDRITDDLLARVARNPQNLGRLRALGMTSVLTVPMAARGHVLGAITFISSAESRRFNDADISLATDLAHRCALAIDNARLHRTAQALVDTERARLAAEAADQIKSEFLATVSHEMRTPLNVIAGYLELLGMEIAGPLTKVQRSYVERIRSGEQQLLRIVEDMLNFVRLYSSAVEYDCSEFAFQPLVGDVVTSYREGMEEKGLTLQTRCADDLRAFADPAKVWQIVMNLLSNARKFTPTGGRVLVECSADGDTVHLRVTDTGAGIPPDKLESIFEPFTQAEGGLTRPAEGMGLGLSISRHLARDMGGDLSVSSEGTGSGCTFTLTLPRHPPSQRE